MCPQNLLQSSDSLEKRQRWFPDSILQGITIKTLNSLEGGENAHWDRCESEPVCNIFAKWLHVVALLCVIYAEDCLSSGIPHTTSTTFPLTQETVLRHQDSTSLLTPSALMAEAASPCLRPARTSTELGLVVRKRRAPPSSSTCSGEESCVGGPRGGCSEAAALVVTSCLQKTRWWYYCEHSIWLFIFVPSASEWDPVSFTRGTKWIAAIPTTNQQQILITASVLITVINLRDNTARLILIFTEGHTKEGSFARLLGSSAKQKMEAIPVSKEGRSALLL